MVSYIVRSMRIEDVSQVAEIDRQAFPTMWPPPSFKRELQDNKLAHYLVACLDESDSDLPAPTSEAASTGSSDVRSSKLRGLASRFSHLFYPHSAQADNNQLVLGFVGLWFMVDEAHITTIAVREKHRRKGIGELLLISAIQLAMERDAQAVTLEVRASNLPAQALYEKYGFSRVGLRIGYYSDNREDAIIMTTERITSASFQLSFQRLKRAHFEKLGLEHE